MSVTKELETSPQRKLYLSDESCLHESIQMRRSMYSKGGPDNSWILKVARSTTMKVKFVKHINLTLHT